MRVRIWEASYGVITYAGVARVPVVEGNKLLGEASDDGNLLLSVVVHDLVSKDRLVLLSRVQTELFMDETVHRRLKLPCLDGSVVWQEGAVELNIVSWDAVIGVVEDGIVVLGLTACLALGGVREVEGVAVWAIVDGVLNALGLLSTEEVVERTILHGDEDDILDLVLEVGDGCFRTGLVGLGGSFNGSCKGKEPKDSSGDLHLVNFEV